MFAAAVSPFISALQAFRNCGHFCPFSVPPDLAALYLALHSVVTLFAAALAGRMGSAMKAAPTRAPNPASISFEIVMCILLRNDPSHRIIRLFSKVSKEIATDAADGMVVDPPRA